MARSISARVLAYLKEQPGTPYEIGKALSLSLRFKDEPWLGYKWGKWSFAKAEEEGLITLKDRKWHLKETELKMKTLEEKKLEIDEYFADKDPADYGAVDIGSDAYDTTSLIVIELDEHGLRLRDGVASEDVSSRSVEEIIETIEDWAQTFRDMEADAE